MTEAADPPIQHTEHHYVSRVGWLRAAVLGANDGIVSTASLIAGVASAGVATSEVLLAGTAGLVAGAMSMAAGEYVSVSSQADTERADLAREAHELEVHFELELEELAGVYVERGVSQELALQVAGQLMEKDALEAHARDELGISSVVVARPLQAAVSSALSFSAGAALPLASVLVAQEGQITMTTTAASVVALGLLGVVSARAGGAPVTKAVIRVMFWGAFAMAVTAAVGSLFNVPVA